MSTRIHLCLDDPEAYSLLCKCGVVYVLHGEALKKKHIVSCGCGVICIDPGISTHVVEVSRGFFKREKKIAPMFHPFIQMIHQA